MADSYGADPGPQDMDPQDKSEAKEGEKKAKKLSRGEQADLIKEARLRIQSAWEKDRKNREEAAVDLKFLAGDQWPDAVKTERTTDGRPMLTINRMPQFLRQVTNPVRSADLSIKTAPVDDKSDPKTAEVFDGLLKQIQYQSSARAVYAACSEHQTACGIGWARVCTEYKDEESFDQELVLKAVPNPLSVYDDPGAVEPDRCDSKWRFITQMMPKADFKAKYPKASQADVTIPSDYAGGLYWFTDDEVRIAEYWKMEPVEKTIGMTDSGETIDMTDIDAKTAKMLGVKQTREVDCYKVVQYLISGNEVLDGPNDWAGKYLPQVPFIGSEVPVENGIYRHGILRWLREPQQMYNYYRTASAESIALAPKAPYIATAKQIGKYQDQWATANTKNRPFMLYDADDKAPPPQRQAPPDTPAALVNESNMAAEDMKGTTGIYDASLGNQSNETSGIAISRRQIQGDAANYHYQDNYQRSLEYLGRVLVDLIPKTYDSERIIRILGEDDSEQFVPINKVIGINPATQQPIIVNDLSAGRFDIRVRIARSADTKRLETAASMMDFLKAFPQAAPLIGDLVAKNSDWPGAEEIAKRMKALVPPQALVDPDDPNTQPPPPPDPMQDPVVASEVNLRHAQAELAHANAVVALSSLGADVGSGQDPLAPFEAQQAHADLQTKIANSLAAMHKARAAGAQADQAQANASKAVADAHGAHLDNAATLDQLAKGWHPTQQKPVPKLSERVRPTNPAPRSVQ